VKEGERERERQRETKGVLGLIKFQTEFPGNPCRVLERLPFPVLWPTVIRRRRCSSFSLFVFGLVALQLTIPRGHKQTTIISARSLCESPLAFSQVTRDAFLTWKSSFLPVPGFIKTKVSFLAERRNVEQRKVSFLMMRLLLTSFL